ncbi:MAG: hypothetical protein PHC51_05440 [bacterium]|nr:hypothetical protein [bacterium]
MQTLTIEIWILSIFLPLAAALGCLNRTRSRGINIAFLLQATVLALAQVKLLGQDWTAFPAVALGLCVAWLGFKKQILSLFSALLGLVVVVILPTEIDMAINATYWFWSYAVPICVAVVAITLAVLEIIPPLQKDSPRKLRRDINYLILCCAWFLIGCIAHGRIGEIETVGIAADDLRSFADGLAISALMILTLRVVSIHQKHYVERANIVEPFLKLARSTGFASELEQVNRHWFPHVIDVFAGHFPKLEERRSYYGKMVDMLSRELATEPPTAFSIDLELQTHEAFKQIEKLLVSPFATASMQKRLKKKQYQLQHVLRVRIQRLHQQRMTLVRDLLNRALAGIRCNTVSDEDRLQLEQASSMFNEIRFLNRHMLGDRVSTIARELEHITEELDSIRHQLSELEKDRS